MSSEPFVYSGKGRVTFDEPVLYGGPTTGKTQFCRWCFANEHLVKDTDHVIEALYPRFFADKIWRSADEAELGSVYTRVSEAVGILHRFFGGGVLFLTNLWAPEFNRGLANRKLLRDPEARYPWGAIRQPEDIVWQSQQRGDEGGGIPLDLARKWGGMWKKYAATGFKALRVLGRLEYFADAYDFSALTDHYRNFRVPSSQDISSWWAIAKDEREWQDIDDAQVSTIRGLLSRRGMKIQ